MTQNLALQTVRVNQNLHIGDIGQLTLIAGPCAIESRELTLEVAKHCKEIAEQYDIPYIFKASFDKANRTSIRSFRGPGLKNGMEILKEIKEESGLPILTDIHQPQQADRVAEVVDILQIPAFLCRQTDLLVAAGRTGKAINIKKGQFMDVEGMRHAMEKVLSTGNQKILLTERGTTFGYNDLIVDMRNLVRMRNLGVPVIFDGTHTVQRPGLAGPQSGGAREFIIPLMRAAVAISVDALFLEVHPNPSYGLSDNATMIDYGMLEEILLFVQEFQKLAHQKPS